MGAHDFGDHTVFTKADNEMPEESKINWRQNCLTVGPHDGRPEALWRLPLLQTTHMFTLEQLQELVVDRIYNDALQFVGTTLTQQGTGMTVRITQAWADQIREYVRPVILPIYQKKVGEITEYYQSPEFKRDFSFVIGLNKAGKLNPRYQPLHSHDTLNLLCRIVGTSGSIEASKDVTD